MEDGSEKKKKKSLKWKWVTACGNECIECYNGLVKFPSNWKGMSLLSYSVQKILEISYRCKILNNSMGNKLDISTIS